jgi:hypothetical protein
MDSVGNNENGSTVRRKAVGERTVGKMIEQVVGVI